MAAVREGNIRNDPDTYSLIANTGAFASAAVSVFYFKTFPII
jgi:hypothetical protein